MFVRSLPLIGLLSLSAFAQALISDLATNEDGSVVYIATSLRVKGSNDFPQGKIYRWSAGEFQLIAMEPQTPFRPDPIISEPYAYISVNASADGSIIAVTKQGDCSSVSSCLYRDRLKAELRTMAGSILPDMRGAYAQVSANGRYVLYEEQRYTYIERYHWVDLFTGAEISIPATEFRASRRGTETDTGGVIGIAPTINDQRLILRMRDGRQFYFSTSSRPREVMVDKGETRAFWSSEDGELYITDLTTKSERKLDASGMPVAISSDATLFLFRGSDESAMPQVYDAASGRFKTLIGAPEGTLALTMSPNGRFVFMSTPLNRLLREDLATGEIKDLVPQTPALWPKSLPVPAKSAPGGRISLPVSGVDANVALPDELSIRVASRTLRPLGRSNGMIDVQLPFGIGPGNLPISVGSSRSPLEGATPELEVADSNPFRLISWPVHGDFRGLANAADPAAPGEILHLYLAGLGEVSPSVAAGTVTPLAPLSRVLNQPSIRLYLPGLVPLPDPAVLFAGLAPGFTGVYQVDIQLPAAEALGPPSMDTFIRVGSDGSIGTFFVPIR